MKAGRTGSVAALMLWVLPGLTGTALAAEKAELRGTGRFEIPGWFKNSFLDIEAFLKGFHVQSMLNYVASGSYKTQPEPQRFIRERADHLRERGVTIDLWE